MKKCLLCCILIHFSTIALAQNTIGLPQILNFNNGVYQGGTQTWDIRQDISGRMYFANNEGLITYDGSYWRRYPQPNRTILRSIALFENRVYAGGQDEIGYYFPDESGLLQYTSLKELIPRNYATFTDVWDIEVYQGSVFFRTWDRIFEYKNNTILTYPAQGGWHFLKKAGNKLYAQDREKGLFIYTSNQWQPVNATQEKFDYEISGIVALDDEKLLISTLQDGLFTFYRGAFTPKSTKADKSFRRNHIYAFEQINNNEFVAGTTSEGCIIINQEGEIIQQIARPEGLQNNNVLCVFLDKERNLWTGLDNGISFITYNAAIKYIKPGKPNEVSGYAARVFNGHLYVATSDGTYMAPVSNTAKDLSFSKGEFSLIEHSHGQGWRLDEVNQRLLLGHHNGSFLIEGKNATQLTKGVGSWLFLPTSSVLPAQHILTGTYAGLSMLEFDKDKFYNKGEIKGMYESLRFMAIDNEDVIWASHPYRGVYRISLGADRQAYTHELFTDQHGLPSTFRNSVFRIQNRVVFATEKGVYEFDPAIKKFIPSPFLYHTLGEIPIQYLNEDKDGNIWFCSGKKIGVAGFRGAGKNAVITYFPELTGKILSGFENIYPFDSRNIFIASNSGVIHLNYEKYIAASARPGILLTQAKSFGETDSLVFGGYYGQESDTAYQQDHNKTLSFANNNNSFRFEFSSPSYSLQNNISYRFYLQGYENDWSAPTTKTEKEYTNLPEGEYVFKVKAFDNLGNESETISYHFIVRPPWYKTIWAYLLYALVAATVIHLLYRWQKRKFILQQQRFEEEQKRLKYIHQLEVEKNEKEIIKLQNEKLISEMVFKNKELADVSMHLVERSDALIKVKDELQRLHKKTGGNHDVKKAIQLLNEIEKNDSNWEQFAAHFDEINNDFVKKLKTKFPHLTSTDLKVCTYLQLKLASKEIAQLMNITVRGVEISRYRLRKKLQLPTGQTLTVFLNEIHGEGATETTETFKK
jgi:ligand-binding sensor domain-containing protein